MPVWFLAVANSTDVCQSIFYLLQLSLLRDCHLLYSKLPISTSAAATPELTCCPNAIPPPPVHDCLDDLRWMSWDLAGDLLVHNSCCARGVSKVGSGSIGCDSNTFHKIWMRATDCFPKGTIPQGKVTNRAQSLRDELALWLMMSSILFQPPPPCWTGLWPHWLISLSCTLGTEVVVVDWALSILTPLAFARKGGLALCVYVMDLQAPPTSTNFFDSFVLLFYFESLKLPSVMVSFCGPSLHRRQRILGSLRSWWLLFGCVFAELLHPSCWGYRP